jgi:ribonuclease HII
VVVDGNPLRTLGVPHHAVVKGDARCYSVACASIVAKVTRDRVMRALGLRYPVYAWVDNVGYATEAHLDGIERHGICRHHRLNFRAVAQTVLALGMDDGDDIEEEPELRDPSELDDSVETVLMDTDRIEPQDQLADRGTTGGADEYRAALQ